MTSFQVAKKSLQLMERNLPELLRICLVLSIVAYLVPNVVTYLATGEWVNVQDSNSDPSFTPTVILQIALTGILGFWVAVAWHRYILLDDLKSGWVPRWNGQNILAYFVQSLKLLGLSMLIGSLFAAFLYFGTRIVGAAIPHPIIGLLFILITIALFLFLAVCIFRLSLVLPAAAVDQPLTFGAAWTQSFPYRRSFLALIGIEILVGLVVLALSFFIGSIFLNFLGLIGGIGFMVLAFAANFFLTMWALSILTTLYGVIIQGREL